MTAPRVVPRSQGAPHFHRGDIVRSNAYRSGYDDGFVEGWTTRVSRPVTLRNRAQRLYGFVGFCAGMATAYGLAYWIVPVLR